MRYKNITTRSGKLMYVFAFEDEKEKNSYFKYWENIIAKSLPQTKEWVQEFTALLQKLKTRTDNKYGTEKYPYSGRLYSDEALTLIYCQQMIILEYQEYLHKAQEHLDKSNELYDRLDELYDRLEISWNKLNECCEKYKKEADSWKYISDKWKNLYFEVKNYDPQPIPDKALAEGRPAKP